jgi:hypothetical protein
MKRIGDVRNRMCVCRGKQRNRPKRAKRPRSCREDKSSFVLIQGFLCATGTAREEHHEMEFSVTKSTLLNELSTTQGVVERHTDAGGLAPYKSSLRKRIGSWTAFRLAVLTSSFRVP